MIKIQNNTREDQGPIFAIFFRIKAKHEMRQILIDFLKWDCEVCMQEDGTLRFDVWVDPADDDAFYDGVRHALLYYFDNRIACVPRAK